MASGAQHQVVILYEHALLAEGIAKYLLTQFGVEATVAPQMISKPSRRRWPLVLRSISSSSAGRSSRST